MSVTEENISSAIFNAIGVAYSIYANHLTYVSVGLNIVMQPNRFMPM